MKYTKLYGVFEYAFEYDDSHFNNTGVDTLSDGKLYVSKAQAEKKSLEANVAFAARVLRDVWPWPSLDGQFGDTLDCQGGHTDEDFSKLLKLLMPETKVRKRASKDTLRHALNEFKGTPHVFSLEELSWVANTFEYFQVSKVREMEVVRGAGRVTAASQIEKLVRERFPYAVTALEIYTDLQDGFARVEADLSDGTEYFHKIEGTWQTESEAKRALLASVRKTIKEAKVSHG